MDPIAVLHTDASGRVTNANRQARRKLGAVVGQRCTDVVALRDASGRPICTERCAGALSGQSEGARESHGTSRGNSMKVHCIAMGAGATILLEAERPPETQVSLSPREHEALSLVAEGLTARRIAKKLGVAESTIRTHLNNAKEKLSARTLPEAVNLLGKGVVSMSAAPRSPKGGEQDGE